jgi:hypothetical protein
MMEIMTKLELQEVHGDSKLLPVFPWSIILKPEKTEQLLMEFESATQNFL